eukprot:scaffold176984_cov61-Attheya_sp.AAC.1
MTKCHGSFLLLWRHAQYASLLVNLWMLAYFGGGFHHFYHTCPSDQSVRTAVLLERIPLCHLPISTELSRVVSGDLIMLAVTYPFCGWRVKNHAGGAGIIESLSR